ncbi:MAG TPA: LamG-like jellyroll fold domain-containing protein [Phycisphaerae bacterium]|nr:LamG-like jellyroll fold domain-containing protein [Phycisphaerae bacterium]
MDGIAISTHRAGGGDHGFGVAPDVFGDLVRHDIKGGVVVKSTVIYAGRARGACISFAGDRVAFLKLDGRVCVMNIDGSGARELKNTKNRNASAIDWPAGDWVYYSEEGSSPDGVFNPREKDDTPDKRTIRRVNVVTGEDELAGVAPQKIWQLSMTANATKTSGRFTVTGALLDFSDPGKKLNNRGLNCGTAVSMNGLYVTEMAHSHADIMIWDWSLGTLLRQFHVNEWAAKPNDGRQFLYRPRWAVNSDRWIVMTQGMDFGCTSQTNMVLYNWRDGQQIQVTDNPLTGSECDEGEDFWLAGMASDFAAGMIEGEAPFTVELASEKLAGRVWQWDYGDGSREKAATGRHTFSKAGHYAVSARDGETVLGQTVTVLKRQPPHMTLRVMDDRHVLAEFDEPMQLKDAAATLASGTAVAGVKAGPLARDLLISLEAALPHRDKLSIMGAFDLAQVPNAPPNGTLSITQPAWPPNRAGLVFLWETESKPSFCLDNARAWFDPVRMNPMGRARFDRFGAMLLEGGAMFATDAARCIAERCRATGEWSIEAVVMPANEYQGRAGSPRRILGCNRDGNPNFAFSLDQEAGNLSVALTVRTPDGPKAHRAVLGAVAADRPHHVIVSYTPGKLRGWLNGKTSFESDVSGQLSWENPSYTDGLHFGGGERTPSPWRGKIEGVAVYSKGVSAEDAAGSFAAYAAVLKARPAIARTRLVGRLCAKAAVPKPEEISPYRDALVVQEYDVLRVVEGKYREKKIRVAHWGLLDMQPTAPTRMTVGAECTLLVERFADHPELEGQVLRELDENLDMVMFCDVSNGPMGEPKLASLFSQPQQVWMPVGMPVQYNAVALDQYGERIKVPVKWSVKPGGSIDVGTAYGAGQHFVQARQPGDGTVSQEGLFTGTKAGTVTITLSSDADPAITAIAIAGVGDYPAVYPASRLPLCIGNERDGMVGDIDRLRLYGRVMTADEAAAHAGGQKLNDEGLIADWTFDELKAGAFANVAGEGLAARVVGEVQHVDDKDGKYVRLARKGWLEVGQDARLDASAALTVEAWVRPKGSGHLIQRQVVWMWGVVVWVDPDAISVDAFRTDGGGLRGGYKFAQDAWTHVAAVFGGSGAWRIYADGKLVAERRAMAAPVR